MLRAKGMDTQAFAEWLAVDDHLRRTVEKQDERRGEHAPAAADPPPPTTQAAAPPPDATRSM